MKRISRFTLLLFVLCSSLLIVSCGEKEFIVDKDDMIIHDEDNGIRWIEFEFDGKYGICDSEGKVIVTPANQISYDIDCRSFVVQKGDGNKQFIEILNESYEIVIPYEYKMLKYTKRPLKKDDSRFFYDVVVLSNDGDTLIGACDKEWIFALAPVPKKKYSIGYAKLGQEYEEPVEYFTLSTHIHNKWVYIYLPTKLDDNGKTVESSIKTNLFYRGFSKSEGFEVTEDYFFTLGIGENYVIKNPSVYYFYKELRGIKIYQRKIKNSNSSSFIFIDKDNDFREITGSSLDIILEGNGTELVSYKKALNSSGENYSVDVYKECLDAQEQHKLNFVKASFAGAATSKEEYLIRKKMKAYANRHFWE